jgi:hypothetical protein
LITDRKKHYPRANMKLNLEELEVSDTESSPSKSGSEDNNMLPLNMFGLDGRIRENYQLKMRKESQFDSSNPASSSDSSSDITSYELS